MSSWTDDAADWLQEQIKAHPDRTTRAFYRLEDS